MSALVEAVNIERHRGEMGASGVITKDLGYDILNFGRSRNDKMMEASLGEYQTRVEIVRDKMIEQNIDVLCVKNEDLRYLTGFHTIGDSEPQTLLLPAKGRPIMVARLLETDLVEKYTWVSQWWSSLDSGCSGDVFTQALLSCVDAKARDSEEAVVGVDLTQITAKHWSDLQALNPMVKFVDATSLIEKVRLTKSPTELDNIRVAAECTRAGIDAGLSAAKKGGLLSEVHLHAYNALIRSGSEEPAYLPIVRSSDPAGHGQWEVNERYGIRRENGRSSGLVFIELSGCRFGHHSPRMQTAYFVSCNPDNSNRLPTWLVEAEDVIVRIFDACLPLMKPGVLPSHIDSVGRRILNSYTFRNANATSAGRMGYTVGGTATNPTGNAGWGDACFSIAGNNHTPLQENQVFHFIPWLQINDGEETGPIGLSDTVIVTPQGGMRVGKHALRIIPLADDGTDLSV